MGDHAIHKAWTSPYKLQLTKAKDNEQHEWSHENDLWETTDIDGQVVRLSLAGQKIQVQKDKIHNKCLMIGSDYRQPLYENLKYGALIPRYTAITNTRTKVLETR